MSVFIFTNHTYRAVDYEVVQVKNRSCANRPDLCPQAIAYLLNTRNFVTLTSLKYLFYISYADYLALAVDIDVF